MPWILGFEYDGHRTYDLYLTIVVSDDLYRFVKKTKELPEIILSTGLGNDSSGFGITLKKEVQITEEVSKEIDGIINFGQSGSYLQTLEEKLLIQKEFENGSIHFGPSTLLLGNQQLTEEEYNTINGYFGNKLLAFDSVEMMECDPENTLSEYGTEEYVFIRNEETGKVELFDHISRRPRERTTEGHVKMIEGTSISILGYENLSESEYQILKNMEENLREFSDLKFCEEYVHSLKERQNEGIHIYQRNPYTNVLGPYPNENELHYNGPFFPNFDRGE